VQFRLLGPLEILRDDKPLALGGAKQRVVLAQLLLHPNALMAADRLIDAVWDEDPPAAARNVLQTYVSRLRKLLGSESLEQRAGGYVLHVDPDEIDLELFSSLVAEARRCETLDPASAVALYREADSLWRGPALDDLGDQLSLRAEIAHLEELRAAAIDERIRLELSLGREAELIPELEALTARDPLRERLWASLMTALYRAGRQADALAVYHRARAILVEELGLEPSADLRRLQQQILQQDPSLSASGRALRGYRLLEQLGEGSFGVVHRALQPQIDREVAIKVIRPALANDPEFIRRFEAEAQLVARLEHPRIVPLYDYWREPDGAFLVMRLLRGGSLRETLAHGPLAPERALTVVEHVGAALAAAHRQGVVHRDVKPANILLDEDGNAYLSDFGIARDVTEESTPQADVYALGVVLYEMLTGDRASRDALTTDVSPTLREIVERATADDPDARYPDASALMDAVATVAPLVASPSASTTSTRNPYKGLRPFFEPDAQDFHGREGLVTHLFERLSRNRLLALVGPSGSGKSSAVHAGLVPAVRRETRRWFVAAMQPGSDPFAELAFALTALAPAPLPAELLERGLVEAAAWLLPDDDSELLLVVDQFEELFTLVRDEGERGRFLDLLQRAVTDARSRVRVVLTLRADYLDRPLTQSGFAEVLRAGTELILPLSAEELERAISGPARGVGATVEPSLVGKLVADVIGQPGALPLLQFTLAELFDHGALTAAGYDELGGIGGSVSRGAEEAFASLGDDSDTARQLFLRLVGVGDRIGRRRVVVSELLSLADGMQSAIDAFARRRLLSFDRDPDTREPTVEVAHESLVTSWNRLRDWVADAGDELRAHRQLTRAAGDWLEAGRDPSFLARGARLARLEGFRESATIALTAAEREFLEASVSEEHARRAKERELEQRSLRRLRALVGVLVVASVVAAALTVFAFDQRSGAEHERRIATARELAAASVANLDEDSERSVLLALQAVDRTRSADGTVLPEALEALHRAVTASRIVLRVPSLGGALDWSPDGSLFVTEGPEESGLIDIRDAHTGRRVRAFHGHDSDVNLVAFSADGSMLATTADDGTLKVWNPRTAHLLHTYGGDGQVWGAAFSPDGSRVAAIWWSDQAVRVFDLRSGRRVAQIRAPAPGFTTSFSPDGRRLAVSALDGGGFVADARSGRRLFALDGSGGANDVDWSPNGKWIATASPDSRVRILDARTGKARFTLSGHKSSVVAADWSADSSRLATGSSDGTAKVWVVDSQEAREQLSISAQERGGGVWVAFSPDGRRLMTGDQGITVVKEWDVSASGGAEWATFPAERRAPGGVTFTADGNDVASGNADGSVTVHDIRRPAESFKLPAARDGQGPGYALDAGRRGMLAVTAGQTARVWDLASRKLPFTVGVPGGPADVAVSADGSFVAVGGFDGGVTIADRTGKQRASLSLPGPHRIGAVEFSRDGRLVAAASMPFDRPEVGAERVTVWDWRRGRKVRQFATSASGLAFSNDGNFLATAPRTGPVLIWNMRTGRLTTRLFGHTGAVNDVAYAPDDSLVATAGSDGTIRLWDPASGRQETILRGHDDVVWDIDFSPDGSRLASASLDGTVRVWALKLDDLIAIAKRKLTRKLSRAECLQYLHAPCD
jgi:WD40 repeat protein/DNA-binding SARP family transcriptional activator/tRNA A-37 threonylcarbamoyl transferase component Bud32